MSQKYDYSIITKYQIFCLNSSQQLTEYLPFKDHYFNNVEEAQLKLKEHIDEKMWMYIKTDIQLIYHILPCSVIDLKYCEELEVVESKQDLKKELADVYAEEFKHVSKEDVTRKIVLQLLNDEKYRR